MISERDIQRARDVDLLSFLRISDPGQLVHFSKDTYCTKDHDSLKISNGKWYWFSRGFGGTSALDYLMKVQDYSFKDAIETVLGEKVYGHISRDTPATPKKKELRLPERNRNTDQ